MSDSEEKPEPPKPAHALAKSEPKPDPVDDETAEVLEVVAAIASFVNPIAQTQAHAAIESAKVNAQQAKDTARAQLDALKVRTDADQAKFRTTARSLTLLAALVLALAAFLVWKNKSELGVEIVKVLIAFAAGFLAGKGMQKR